MNETPESLLKQLIELIEAHEITCFSCDRDGEEHCDCLERMVKRCKNSLTKEGTLIQ